MNSGYQVRSKEPRQVYNIVFMPMRAQVLGGYKEGMTSVSPEYHADIDRKVHVVNPWPPCNNDDAAEREHVFKSLLSVSN
jgi:hypothetical protein